MAKKLPKIDKLLNEALTWELVSKECFAVNLAGQPPLLVPASYLMQVHPDFPKMLHGVLYWKFLSTDMTSVSTYTVRLNIQFLKVDYLSFRDTRGVTVFFDTVSEIDVEGDTLEVYGRRIFTLPSEDDPAIIFVTDTDTATACVDTQELTLNSPGWESRLASAQALFLSADETLRYVLTANKPQPAAVCMSGLTFE